MDQLFLEANELFDRREYDHALSCYNQLIDESTQSGSSVDSKLLVDYYFRRALTHDQLDQFQLASKDLCKCLEILEKEESASGLLVRCYFRLGLCEFKLENYSAASVALYKAQQLGSQETNLYSMLQTCREKLSKQPVSKPESNSIVSPKIRHEWYQTDSYVYVSIFIKQLRPEDVSVEFLPREFTLTVKQPSGSDLQFSVEPLAQKIDASQSAYTIFSTKIELRLKKEIVGVKWRNLEGEEGDALAAATSVQESRPSYPTSSRKPKNWDALSKEAEKEEEQEDQGLNALFQKIYREADEDTRRAMLKSFTESNGTALSTDWKDVSSRKYETRPPDGMEARQWDK